MNVFDIVIKEVDDVNFVKLGKEEPLLVLPNAGLKVIFATECDFEPQINFLETADNESIKYAILIYGSDLKFINS